MIGSGRVLRLMVFLAAFTLEVKVKAAENVQLPNALEVQQSPEGCLPDAGVCAVRTGAEEKFKLIMGASTVHMDRSTAVVRLSDGAVNLVEGTVWVQAKEPLSVKTEFGEAKIAKGEFWVSRTQEKMMVSATGGTVELLARGASEPLEIERGWENWLGKIGKDGSAETGLPRAIPFAEHLARWARLYTGNRAQFEKDVRQFREVWGEASRQAAQVHEALFARKVAAIEAEKARQREELRKRQARDRELIQIFRRKVLEE